MLSNLKGSAVFPHEDTDQIDALLWSLSYPSDILAMLNSLLSFYLLPPITFRFSTYSITFNPLLSHSCNSEGLGWNPRFWISNKIPENNMDATINYTQACLTWESPHLPSSVYPNQGWLPNSPSVTTMTWGVSLTTTVCLSMTWNFP